VLTDDNGMGSAVGDFDNDGDLDWFVTSIYTTSLIPIAGRDRSPNGNRLYRNEDGTFTDVTGDAGVADGGWGWGACFLDLDNDGHLDIYHTNGYHTHFWADYAIDPSKAFLSDG